jgi:hypothetical protein
MVIPQLRQASPRLEGRKHPAVSIRLGSHHVILVNNKKPGLLGDLGGERRAFLIMTEAAGNASTSSKRHAQAIVPGRYVRVRNP